MKNTVKLMSLALGFSALVACVSSEANAGLFDTLTGLKASLAKAAGKATYCCVGTNCVRDTGCKDGTACGNGGMCYQAANSQAAAQAAAEAQPPAAAHQQSTRGSSRGPAKKQFCCAGGKCMNSACTAGDGCDDAPGGAEGDCYATAAEGKQATAAQ